MHPRIQELLDYLELHSHGLREAVASVPARLHEIKPRDGGWSVAEVVEHLALIEKRVALLLTRQVAAARASGVGPDTETSSVVATFANPSGVVDRGRKIVAPEPVRPTGALDTESAQQALDQSRAAIVLALHDANGVSLENLMQSHPVFGPLNMYHWIVAAALHEDRHAAQIREIGKSLSAT
ncbi:MAG TPA: DinB family protein [Gemmatimonadaceae bacterium]|nr:DinB family protein [Gemmatimonadaceae bacterium]